MPDLVRLEHFVTVLKTVRDRGYGIRMRGWISGWNACYGGWAARDVTFQREGLIGLQPEEAGNKRGAVYLDVKPRLMGFDALRVFFDLDHFQTDYLFADNPWLLGFDDALTCDEEIVRIREIMRGEV